MMLVSACSFNRAHLRSAIALTASQIASHAESHNAIRRLTQKLLTIHDRYPRIASVFVTEQRAMMGSIALRLYFSSLPGLPRNGFVLARFVEEVEAAGVASRNTADGFVKEMHKYGYIRQFEVPGDRRLRPFEPTEVALTVFFTWAIAHLQALDDLDGGERAVTVTRNPDIIARLHPQLSSDLIGDGPDAEYSQTLGLFAWVVNSKLLTGRLLAGMGDVVPDASRVATDIDSLSGLAKWMNVSQTHLTRKMREAEAIGSIGWEGRRGQSRMWISTGFLKEMIDECAARLAVFDAACDALFGNREEDKSRG